MTVLQMFNEIKDNIILRDHEHQKQVHSILSRQQLSKDTVKTLTPVELWFNRDHLVLLLTNGMQVTV